MRWSLTLGLGLTATLALLFAPRLVAPSGDVGVTVMPTELPTVTAIDDPVVEPTVVEPPSWLVQPDRPMATPPPVHPTPPPVRGGIAEMDVRPAPPTSLIPEATQPRPQPQPILDIDFWDDCPACGMG